MCSFLLVGLLLPQAAWAMLAGTTLSSLQPFDLSVVTLHHDSVQAKAASLNVEYLLDMLEADRLLWTFRENAGVSTGAAAPLLGTWEAPSCEVRGHFMGHYLTALAFVYNSTGNSTVKVRIGYLVSELHNVQLALGGGYLSAFPAEHFDRLQSFVPVWAPYYVIHKIMAGLLDAWELAGASQARPMAEDMASYFLGRIDETLRVNGSAHWERMLNVEFGGMNDVMYRLYRLTGNPDHLRMAHLFDKPVFFNPLAAGKDPLAGLHANTHLAQVNGFASRYEATQDPAAQAAVATFFSALVANHSYATGGSNDHEYWGEAQHLGRTLAKQADATETQETCTQYNVLKIARSLYLWSCAPALADFYERALLNGILGASRLPWPMRRDGSAAGGDAAGRAAAGAEAAGAGAAGGEAAGGLGRHDAPHLIQQQQQQQQQQMLHEHDHEQEQDHGHSTHAHNHLGVPPHQAEFAGLPMVPADTRTHGHSWRQLAGAPLEPEPWAAATEPAGHRRVAGQQQQQQHQDGSSALHKTPESRAGPGVYLYLLPLGAGQTKDGSTRRWGSPLGSFWCCYGTAVESFAKLADSIYFRRPATAEAVPELHIIQFVSSTLDWEETGLKLVQNSSMYAPGPAASVQLLLRLQAPAELVLQLRIPEWAGPGAAVAVNRRLWQDCPGDPSPQTPCRIQRTWSDGDTLSMSLPMRYRVLHLPGGHAGLPGLKALLMGPFVMAGLTHRGRRLVAGEEDIENRLEEVEETGLVALKASWDSHMFLHVDSYHVHVSPIEEEGDHAMDAAFRVHACKGVDGDRSSSSSSSTIGGGSSSGMAANRGGEAGSGSGAPAAAACGLRHLATAQRDGTAVALESLSHPGMFLAASTDGTMVLLPSRDGGGCSNGCSSGGCSTGSFYVRRGLDGRQDSLSFESVSAQGGFLSASGPPPACEDLLSSCREDAQRGDCDSTPESMMLSCRRSCGACSSLPLALLLTAAPINGGAALPSWAATASFVAASAAGRLPQGAKLLRGDNRAYLVAPLANTYDERYTGYFEFEAPAASHL